MPPPAAAAVRAQTFATHTLKIRYPQLKITYIFPASRFKTFEFVAGPVKEHQEVVLEEAVYVCAFLANFSRLLVE